MIPVIDFDRFLMAFSLGVHIILASVGIALPAIIVIAEIIGIRNGDRYYSVIARRLSIVLVVLFAIGTASGTLVALELFLLWPGFMVLVGQVAILPLYIEVFAFFLEAIFLAIYIYGWDKFSNRYAHALVGVIVGIGATAHAQTKRKIIHTIIGTVRLSNFPGVTPSATAPTADARTAILDTRTVKLPGSSIDVKIKMLSRLATKKAKLPSMLFLPFAYLAHAYLPAIGAIPSPNAIAQIAATPAMLLNEKMVKNTSIAISIRGPYMTSIRDLSLANRKTFSACGARF